MKIKCKANVGDKIQVVNPYFKLLTKFFYKKGDVFTVSEVHDGYISESDFTRYDEMPYVKVVHKDNLTLYDREYEVIERCVNSPKKRRIMTKKEICEIFGEDIDIVD